jgi:hypothetical protein
VPVHAGEHVLGVRASSEAAASAVHRVLEPRLARGTPPANVSLLLEASAARAPTPLHGLFVPYARTVTTGSVRRVLAALWHEADRRDALLDRARPQVSATVLIRDHRAFLLPPAVTPHVAADRRRWSAAGFALVDRRNIDLDLGTRTVTIPEPPIDRIGTAVEELCASGVSDRPDLAAARPGTYPIAEWVLLPDDRTLAERVLEAATQLIDLPRHGGAQAVEQLATLLASTPDRRWTHLAGLRGDWGSVA